MNTDFLWVEKYRPKTVQETILPDYLKKIFQTFVDNKEIPNLILTGTAGVGKTTIARAMLEEIGAEYIVVNGSLEGRQIDTLRNLISNFASSVSFNGQRKYVILDEADYLNPQTMQPALRNFMEELSSNCGFILTCNYKNKIIEPLHSRCGVIEFALKKQDKKEVASQIHRRLINILKAENVPYDKNVIAQFVLKYFPDWRRVINELQKYSATGQIDTGILGSMSSNNAIDELFGYLSDKNFAASRKWLVENTDISHEDVFKRLYELATPAKMESDAIAMLVVIVAKYQYQQSFVANPEINMAACFAEIMVSCF